MGEDGLEVVETDTSGGEDKGIKPRTETGTPTRTPTKSPNDPPESDSATKEEIKEETKEEIVDTTVPMMAAMMEAAQEEDRSTPMDVDENIDGEPMNSAEVQSATAGTGEPDEVPERA